MALLTRFRVWLATLLDPRPRLSSPERAARLMDLMERRMKSMGDGRLPTAYDPRIERERWSR